MFWKIKALWNGCGSLAYRKDCWWAAVVEDLWKITIDGLWTLLPFLGFVIVTKLCVDDIFNGFSFLSCLNLKWHVSYTFLWQRAAFPILRCTNCLGVGILASLGYNVPRFKTWELTDRFPGVPQGRVCQTVFSRSPSNFLLLGCLASCCTCFRGPVVMGFFGARKVDLYQPCKFLYFFKNPLVQGLFFSSFFCGKYLEPYFF